DVRLSEVAPVEGGLHFTVAYGGETVPMRLPLPGRHNAGNAAAAVAIGLALGVPLAAAAAGLGRGRPGKGRLHWRRAGGVRLLGAPYTASPVSLRAALDTLREAGPDGRMWVVFGDMLELGPASDVAHLEAGRWIATLPVAGLATAGAASRATAAEAAGAGCPDVAACASPREAAAHVAPRVLPGDRVLVKRSLSMRIDEAIAALLDSLDAR